MELIVTTMFRLFKTPVNHKRNTVLPSPLTASLQVPAFGIIDLPWPSDIPDADIPAVPFGGSLNVNLSSGSGPVKIARITVSFQVVARLEREGQTERVIYKLDEAVIASERVIYGFEQIPFNLLVAGNIAPHDWHPEGSVNYTLCARIYGTPALIDSRIDTSDTLPNGAETGCFLPSYSAGSDAYVDLSCNIEIRQSMSAVYNPQRDEGFSDLDMQGGGDLPGLGIFKLFHYSSLWCVGALVKTCLEFPDPSPMVTIYAVRLSLIQTLNVSTSFPDPNAKSVAHKRSFELWTAGIIPGRTITDAPALWRNETGQFKIDKVGRLPDDEVCRPSTPDRTITPLRVSHELVVHVWFSVKGEDTNGQLCSQEGTALRVLVLGKNTVIPNCDLVPELMGLPQYEKSDSYLSPARTELPCQECRQKQRGGPKVYPLPEGSRRHFHEVISIQDGIAIVHKDTNTPEGQCGMCGKVVILPCSRMWKDCCCGLTWAELEAKMVQIDTNRVNIQVKGQL